MRCGTAQRDIVVRFAGWHLHLHLAPGTWHLALKEQKPVVDIKLVFLALSMKMSFFKFLNVAPKIPIGLPRGRPEAT